MRNFSIKIIYALGVVLVIWLIVSLFSFKEVDDLTQEQEKNIQKKSNFENDYAIHSLDIPEKLSFAGEDIPVHRFDVMESFDKELLINTYWQSHTLLYIKRANKYFPLIEKILKENNVPDDFKYLAVAESDLTNAVSPSGARGFWQFLTGTAKDYDLEVNTVVDERYNLEKATKAACEYLKEAYKEFGDWTMVAASYNVGRGAVKKQIERQKEDNYFDMTLNSETGRYVYRISAIKTILENPTKYGFHVKKEHKYTMPETIIVEVDTSINNLADFAHNYSISYKTLKYFNPWLRQNYLVNKTGKKYQIKIPTKEYRFEDYKSN